MIEIFDKYDYGDFNKMKEKYYPYAMFIIEDWTTLNYDNGKFNIFVFGIGDDPENMAVWHMANRGKLPKYAHADASNPGKEGRLLVE